MTIVTRVGESDVLNKEFNECCLRQERRTEANIDEEVVKVLVAEAVERRATLR